MTTRSGAFDADVVVVGAGPAGSLMAMQLAATPELSGLRVVVIDPLSRPLAGRWWAYWGRQPLVPGADSGVWDRLRLQDADRLVDVALGEYRYRRMDGEALAELLDEAVRAAPSMLQVVATVAGVVHSDDAAVVQLASGESITTRWVLDSTTGPVADVTGPWLSFLGWRVWAESALISADVVGLMDFRVPQRDGLRFGYVLPETADQSFLELCSFRYGGPDPTLSSDMPGWVGEQLAGHGFRADPVQEAAYPLLTSGRRRLGPRILAIGHRAGLVRSSTGYGLVSYARDATAVAGSLARHGHPFDLPDPGRRYAVLDRIALEVLRTDPAALQQAYLDMFSANPADRVLRFLDGSASASAVARLVRTMPVGPFTRAAARQRSRRS